MTLSFFYIKNIWLLLKKYALCKEMKVLDRHMYAYLRMNVYVCVSVCVSSRDPSVTLNCET